MEPHRGVSLQVYWRSEPLHSSLTLVMWGDLSTGLSKQIELDVPPPRSLQSPRLKGPSYKRVESAVEANEPSLIAQYALELAESVHSFAHHHRILDGGFATAEDGTKVKLEFVPERLLLVEAARRTLAKALALLGLEAVERM